MKAEFTEQCSPSHQSSCDTKSAYWHCVAACLSFTRWSLDSFLCMVKQLITILHYTDSWADRVWAEIDTMLKCVCNVSVYV